jgi:hypothetical protein
VSKRGTDYGSKALHLNRLTTFFIRLAPDASGPEKGAKSAFNNLKLFLQMHLNEHLSETKLQHFPAH